MTRSKRILAITAGVLVLLLALLVILPLVFRDRIAARVKTEINQSVEAKVDWRDVGLGFFHDFPNLTLTLDDLTAVGVGRFQGDTLAAIGRFGVSLDLASVVRNAMGGSGPIVVRSIELDRPRLRLVKLEDGAANWDITKKTPEAAPETAAAKPVAVSLRRFTITDANVAVDNRQAGLSASVFGYDQTLSGDFQQDIVAIQTTAGSDSVSVTFAGIPYLNRVKLDLKADVQADLARKSYTLKDTELKLNDLLLAASGSATAAGEDLALDLAFGAPSTEFRHILSLVPAVYTRDFQSVKTAGKIAVSGKVKGNYGEKAFPSFALDVKVDNGAFQYPDLPLPARDIFMDLNLANPGGDADSTVVSLKRFHVVIGRDPMNAELVLRTPISDPDVDLKVAGRLDLANVRKTMKLEGIDELSGTVAADAAVRTKMSYIDKKQYDRIGAQGSVNVGNLAVKGQGLPQPLSIKEASLRLSPQQAELRSFTGSIGSSDLQASGTLENLIGFALRDSVLRGNATVRSNKFNLNEWQSGEGELEVIPVPANIDFGLDATVNELTYAKLKMSNARGRLRVKDQRVTLENFRLNTLGGEIGVTGFYETTTPAKPTFDVGLKMVKLDIPSAFTALTTVQMLAPVAKYARGNFTTDLKISGGLGKDMMPLFNGLNGNGSLQTSQMVLQDFPALQKLVDVTKLQFLDNPTMRSLTHRVPDQGRPAARQPVLGEPGADHHERERLQRARPVVAVRAQAAGAALGAGPGRESGGLGPRVASRRGGVRYQHRVGDRSRHPARRDGDATGRQGGRGERGGQREGDADRCGEGGGREEGGLRGDEAGGGGRAVGRRGSGKRRGRWRRPRRSRGMRRRTRWRRRRRIRCCRWPPRRRRTSCGRRPMRRRLGSCAKGM